MNLATRDGFLAYTSVFLLAMLLVTMVLAAWTGQQPLRQVHFAWQDLGIAVAAAVTMMGVFGAIAPVRHQAEEILGAALAACRWYDLVILAILVGIIEELLFRGVLEPWLAEWHPGVAFVVVNLVFGLLHAVSLAYAVVAATLGCFMSLLAYGPGEYNLLRPIVTHGVYDFLGFVWIATSYRRRAASLASDVDEEP